MLPITASMLFFTLEINQSREPLSFLERGWGEAKTYKLIAIRVFLNSFHPRLAVQLFNFWASNSQME